MAPCWYALLPWHMSLSSLIMLHGCKHQDLDIQGPSTGCNVSGILCMSIMMASEVSFSYGSATLTCSVRKSPAMDMRAAGLLLTYLEPTCMQSIGRHMQLCSGSKMGNNQSRAFMRPVLFCSPALQSAPSKVFQLPFACIRADVANGNELRESGCHNNVVFAFLAPHGTSMLLVPDNG